MRMNMARPSPTLRALPCCSVGSLPARMEMKMTLSMPRTISSTVSVNSAIQLSGLLSHSIVLPPQTSPAEPRILAQ